MPAKCTIPFDKALHAYQETGSQDRAAAALGIHPNTLLRILHDGGFRPGVGHHAPNAIPRPGRSPVHPLPMDEVAARYQAGESTIDLGKAYSVDAEVIRRRMDRAGIARRGLVASRARGEKSPQWKGGEPAPMHYYRRQSYEVAAICLGQPLPPGWVIHHVDENPHNNAPANLILFPSQRLHARFHQQLLRRRIAVGSEVAIRLASEIGAEALPSPPAPIVFAPDTKQRGPYKSPPSPPHSQRAFVL